MRDPYTGRPILKWDFQIKVAAEGGYNDRAYELSVWQKQYYESYCTDPTQLQEWQRRKAEDKEKQE